MPEEPRVWRSSVKGKYYRQTRSQVFEAQIIQPSDIEAIEAVVVLDEVLGLARPQYKLRQICRGIRMDSLVATIPIATKLTGQRKVAPLVEARISAEVYTAVDFNLWKNVAHVVLADESMKKAGPDILRMNIDDAGRDLPRMENLDVDDSLDGATEVGAGGAWDAMTTPPTSDNNPFDDFLDIFETLDGKGYPPEWAVMAPKVWKAFITNSYVKDLVHAGIATIGPTGGQFTIPGWPTCKVMMDHAVTPNTSCYVLSESAPALVFGEGPTEAARYRDEKAGYDAYIIRQWLQPQLVLEDAIREITGAHS